MSTDAVLLTLAAAAFIVGVVLFWIWWRGGPHGGAQQSPVEAFGLPEPPAPTTGARKPWWRMPDGWIAPGVAVVVLALVATVLVLAVLGWPR